MSIAIVIVAMIWSLLIYVMYTSTLSSCMDESDSLRMAVERKDRFVELLRDQNDELKAQLSKLKKVLIRVEGLERNSRERMFLIKELPVVSNGTV